MTTEIKTIADPLAFADWVETAQPGERITYHVGLLMRDRKKPRDDALNLIANSAWKSFEKGKLVLTQRRISNDQYEYSATKTPMKQRGGIGGQWK